MPINNMIQVESLNQHKNNDKAKILQLIEKIACYWILLGEDMP